MEIHIFTGALLLLWLAFYSEMANLKKETIKEVQYDIKITDQVNSFTYQRDRKIYVMVKGSENPKGVLQIRNQKALIPGKKPKDLILGSENNPTLAGFLNPKPMIVTVYMKVDQWS